MTEREAANVLAGVTIGGLGPIAVAAALVPLREHLAPANVALILVLVVVAAAAVGGRVAGMVAAGMSAVAFDFFFTAPYLSLTIASGDDVETAGVLLAVGALVGALGNWGRHQHDAVARSHDDVRAIHRVAEAAAAGGPWSDLVALACHELQVMLHLADCRFEAGTSATPFVRIDRNGAFDPRPHHLHYTPGGFELPPEGVAVPVRRGGDEIGRIVMLPSPGVAVPVARRLVAVVIADQLGAVPQPAPA